MVGSELFAPPGANADATREFDHISLASADQASPGSGLQSPSSNSQPVARSANSLSRLATCFAAVPSALAASYIREYSTCYPLRIPVSVSCQLTFGLGRIPA